MTRTKLISGKNLDLAASLWQKGYTSQEIANEISERIGKTVHRQAVMRAAMADRRRFPERDRDFTNAAISNSIRAAGHRPPSPTERKAASDRKRQDELWEDWS